MKVVIIDSGGANLASLVHAFERLGVLPTISNEVAIVQRADRLVLPGVGHAKTAMKTLIDCGLLDVLRQGVVPLLGICVGLQQLCGWCDEGGVDGLGVINRVSSHRLTATKDLRVPHMGWNTLTIHQSDDPLVRGVSDGGYVYFVHSYYLEAKDMEQVNVATVCYGTAITAIARRGLWWGTQFHPERSGTVGARVLQNFLELSDADLSRC